MGQSQFQPYSFGDEVTLSEPDQWRGCRRGLPQCRDLPHRCGLDHEYYKQGLPLEQSPDMHCTPMSHKRDCWSS